MVLHTYHVIPLGYCHKHITPYHEYMTLSHLHHATSHLYNIHIGSQLSMTQPNSVFSPQIFFILWCFRILKLSLVSVQGFKKRKKKMCFQKKKTLFLVTTRGFLKRKATARVMFIATFNGLTKNVYYEWNKSPCCCCCCC